MAPSPPPAASGTDDTVLKDGVAASAAPTAVEPPRAPAVDPLPAAPPAVADPPASPPSGHGTSGDSGELPPHLLSPVPAAAAPAQHSAEQPAAEPTAPEAPAPVPSGPSKADILGSMDEVRFWVYGVIRTHESVKCC